MCGIKKYVSPNHEHHGLGIGCAWAFILTLELYSQAVGVQSRGCSIATVIKCSHRDLSNNTCFLTPGFSKAFVKLSALCEKVASSPIWPMLQVTYFRRL